jgi:hypothetical protein
VLDQLITIRFDDRWPQGIVGSRDTRIIKNARIYLATTDEQVIQVGWGDLCLEQWHLLRAICGEELLLVAFEASSDDPSRAPGATLADLVPQLVLALDSTSAVLLNHPDPGRHTLGALSLLALDPAQTRGWVADRLTALTDRT